MDLPPFDEVMFSRWFDDEVGHVMMNPNYCKLAPIAALPQMLRVILTMNEVGESGYGSDREGEEMAAAEDALRELAHQRGVGFPGRVRLPGRWDFYFYTAPTVDARALCDEIQSIGQRTISAEVADDPAWAWFADIAPKPEDWDAITTAKVCERLAVQGDNGEEPRSIRHWVYFGDDAGRRGFEADATAERFITVGQRDGCSGDFAFGLQVERVDQATFPEISEVTDQLRSLADRHNGDYDGWESPVVKG
ncbi:MAG: DUF695 domain-containing protein [Planctomycetota bacterium]